MGRPILPKQEERDSPGLESVKPVRTTPSIKRRCISSACVPCRKRKSKCDGAMPACSTCTAVYRMECVYDHEGDRRRKSTTEKDRKGTDMLDKIVARIRTAPENEVGTIVDQLRTIGTIDTSNPIGPMKHEKRKSTDEEREQITVKDMGKLQMDDCGDVRHFGHSSNLESIHSWPRRVALGPQTTTGGLWTNVTTDNELITELLDLYFIWHHPVHVLFSKSCFLSDLKRQRRKYCSPLLVNAILALAAHYSDRTEVRSDPDDPSTTGNLFFAECRQLLLAEEGHSSLTIAQALALMALREAGCGRDTTSWMYFGRALHVALDLGLHLPAKLEASTQFSPTEMEVRKITFWGLFVVDKLWSMHFGRIPQLPSSVVGIPKPSVIQQLEAEPWISPDRTSRSGHIMEIAIQYAELSEVLGHALAALHSPKQQFDVAKLHDFYSKLRGWRRRIPKYMDPQEDAVPAVFVLHMFYQSILLLIFRPFRQLAINSFSETPRQISVNAAIELCTVFSYYHNAGYDSRPLGLLPHALLSAAHVFLQEQIHSTTTDELYLPITSHLEQCIVHLRKMSATWELSSQTLHVIWNLAAGLELPARLKKALYPETISSLASIQASILTSDLNNQTAMFSELDSGVATDSECKWLKSASDSGGPSSSASAAAGSGNMDIAASVADLLREVEDDADLDMDGWADPFE
ncbi:fungal-specific transcription factor domain-containing protein [Sphaerosporella brunnea]|uniref:Fungal-specific transcription factor domain-containing protein n=1 Tax=Sphaerosporella brunnea TaxID=1250544 RepID=A0A5J5F328_9PEZI|nr:fungal-specific transcription factor domain-containing protein [Sphaerosporella brunnea]